MLQKDFGWFDAVDKFSGSANREELPTESGSADENIQKQRILVVDDEKRIADTLCEILVESGFDAVAAYDGWTALDTAARFHPHYLLSDVLMPRMNGVELAITIRNTNPGIKILLFSGQAGISEILETGRKRGFTFQLIPKPIHPLKLIDQLKTL